MYGAIAMYLLGVLLIMDIVEPVNEDDPRAHIRVALLWPWVAVVSIFWHIIYGEDDEDGTSSN